MRKNALTVVISCFIGLFIVYLLGIFYHFTNLDNKESYYIKDIESLNFHKKYTNKLHHIKGLPGITENENIKPESYLFSEINRFDNKNYRILIQGDSNIEDFGLHKSSYQLAEKFAKKNEVGLINAGVTSYSPSVMSLQLDVLEDDFNIYPNILVTYIDQTDIGDEICRYKNNLIFNKNNVLVKIRTPYYSRHTIFDYTKDHHESAILMSRNPDILKAIQLMNFNLKLKILKRKNILAEKFSRILKGGWKNRKLPKCHWGDIQRPLIEHNSDEIAYFKDRLRNYFDKIIKKPHIKKIFIVTFPHKQNLFPSKNLLGQVIYYKLNVSYLVEKTLNNYNDIEHINFSKKIIGREKYIYDNAYTDDGSHLNKEFHHSLFTKTIFNRLEEYLKNHRAVYDITSKPPSTIELE